MVVYLDKKPKEKTKDHNETMQKIAVLKKFINKIDSGSKENIENQIHSHKWILKLIEDQLKQNKTHYTLVATLKLYSCKKDKLDSNVTARKRKLLLIAPMTSEERLKDLPSIYTHTNRSC